MHILHGEDDKELQTLIFRLSSGSPDLALSLWRLIPSHIQEYAGGLLLCVTHERSWKSSHPLQDGHMTTPSPREQLCSRYCSINMLPQDIDAPLRLAAQRKISSYRQQYASNNNLFFLFSRPFVSTSTRMHDDFLLLFSSRPTARPRSTSLLLECHRNATGHENAFSPRGPEEQSRTRGGQIVGVADLPQYRQLLRSRNPHARPFARSPSSRHPLFTQYPLPTRLLVRGGQPSPYTPRLVVSPILLERGASHRWLRVCVKEGESKRRGNLISFSAG